MSNLYSVSIIVPIYNSESTLEQCLNSLSAQTLSSIEIILINDGSTDNSPNICMQFCKKDKRFHQINKCNGGLASARNAGLSLAKGEYIGFVDSDDWVEMDMYQKMFEIAKKHDCDIVWTNVFRDQAIKQKKFLECGLYDRNDIEEKIFPRLLAVCDEKNQPGVLRWSNVLRIYKHELVKSNNISFNPQFRRCQDLPFTFEATIFSQRYYYLGDDYLYHNRWVPNSLSRGYTPDMWKLIRPLVEYLSEKVRSYSEYDFSVQMNMRAFLFAIECIENEVKPTNRDPFILRIKRIKKVMNDELVRGVIPRLDGSRMLRRTRMYLMAFQYRLPQIAYMIARRRFRRQRKDWNLYMKGLEKA